MAKQPGKKIQTWVFDPEGIALKIEVRMYVVDRRSIGYSEDDDQQKEIGKTKFLVSLPEYELEDRDTDIDKLKDRVFKTLSKSARPDWKKMLHVELLTEKRVRVGKAYRDERRPYRIHDVELKFKVDAVEIATRANGDKIHRKQGEKDINQKWPEEKFDEQYHWSDGWMCAALIEDTTENRAALAQLEQGFERLIDGLNELLKPDVIVETLKVAAAKLLLPAAREEEKNVKKQGK